MELFEYAKNVYGSPVCICDDAFKEYAECVMAENSLCRPKNVTEALQLLSLLITDIENYL